MRFSIFFALVVLVMCGCGDAPPTIDGYTYKTVKIGEQEWFAENLRTTVYANGEEILYPRADESWTTLEIGMRCSYDHDEARSAQYGQLYNWYSVDDERGLCPSGWHVPSDEDWQDLKLFLGMSRADAVREGFWDSDEIYFAKLRPQSGWDEDNGMEDLGFSALPGGHRCGYDGTFYDHKSYGDWWSSSPRGGSAWDRFWYDYSGRFLRENNYRRCGHYVRCLKDTD